jgi:hypothetical protein
VVDPVFRQGHDRLVFESQAEDAENNPSEENDGENGEDHFSPEREIDKPERHLFRRSYFIINELDRRPGK